MTTPRKKSQTKRNIPHMEDSRKQLNRTPFGKAQTVVVGTGRMMALVVIISLVVGGFSGALFADSEIFSAFKNVIGSSSTQSIVQKVDTQTIAVEEESQTIDVVALASESVVSIIITKDLSQYYNSTGPRTSPFDEFLFQFGAPDGGIQEIGGGTGFIVSEDGLIVTNKHVVSDTDAGYTVLLNNRESYTAKVVATDPLNDIAFVKIDTDATLQPLLLGDSSVVQIGQTAIAIGNALGEYRNTVTKGIVSGLARTVIAGDGTGSQETLENVIQTDAAINPGNSGGPLLNIAGQVIGVNTAINLEGQLIGFAIPINQVKEAIDSVKENGRVVRPMLGVRYVSVTPELAEQNDLAVDYGALIVSGATRNESAVIKDSAADHAGLAEDDIILAINDERIEGTNTLSKLIQKNSAGDQITLTYLRDDKEVTVQVDLDELLAS